MQSLTESQLFPQIISYLKSLGYEFVESGFRYTETNRAPISVDIMIFDNQHKPFAVVEVKNELPSTLSKFHPAVDQAYQYAQQLNAPYFLVADGKNASWYKIDTKQSKFEFISTPPQYNKKQEPNLQVLQIDESIKQIYDAIDLLRGNIKRHNQNDVLFAFLLAKIFDEENPTKQGVFQFQIYSDETDNETKLRISNLYKTLIKKQRLPLDGSIIESLDPLLVQKVVKQIENLKIKGSNIIDELIEEIGGTSKNSGVYPTPVLIRNFISQLFEFTPKSIILDPALGTGGFFASVSINLRNDKNNNLPQLVGMEANASTVMLASAQLSTLGILDKSKVFLADFLSPNSQQDLLKLSKGGFDFVITSPPFGYRLGLSYEAEYLNGIINLLKNEAYAAVLLTEGFLANSRHRETRESLISRVNILAVVSLPTGAFYPFSGVKTSIVIFSKKGSESIDTKTLFLQVPNIKEKADDLYLRALEACRYFIKTKKLQKSKSIQLAPVVAQLNLENGWRMDYTAFASEYIQVIEQLKRIDAQTVSLGDVAKVKLGYLLSDKLPDNTPVISLRDLKNDWFSSEDETLSSHPSEMYRFDDIKLKPGDLIMSSALGEDNPVFLVPETNKVAVANRSLLVITPNQERIDPSYLFALLKHDVAKIQLKRLSVGSTIRSASPRLLREIQIPLMALREQRRIGAYIAQYHEHQRFAKKALKTADNELDLFFGSNKVEENDENS